MRGKVIRWA